jgi:hypothetical protein
LEEKINKIFNYSKTYPIQRQEIENVDNDVLFPSLLKKRILKGYPPMDPLTYMAYAMDDLVTIF